MKSNEMSVERNEKATIPKHTSTTDKTVVYRFHKMFGSDHLSRLRFEAESPLGHSRLEIIRGSSVVVQYNDTVEVLQPLGKERLCRLQTADTICSQDP